MHGRMGRHILPGGRVQSTGRRQCDTGHLCDLDQQLDSPEGSPQPPATGALRAFRCLQCYQLVLMASQDRTTVGGFERHSPFLSAMPTAPPNALQPLAESLGPSPGRAAIGGQMTPLYSCPTVQTS